MHQHIIDGARIITAHTEFGSYGVTIEFETHWTGVRIVDADDGKWSLESAAAATARTHSRNAVFRLAQQVSK